MKKIISRILFGISIVILAALPMSAGTGIGERAERFQLKTIPKGTTVDLAKMKGHPTMVVFWATWCPPCRKEIPLLMKLHRDYGPRGLKILAVALNYKESRQRVLNFAKDVSIPYTVLWDENDKVSHTYLVRGIPTTLLIDSKGIIRFRGFALNSTFKAALDKLFPPEKKKASKKPASTQKDASSEKTPAPQS